MRRARIIWALWLAAMLMLLVITDNYGIQLVLALSIILPAAGIVFAVISSKKLEAEISCSISQAKGQPFDYTLHVKNGGMLTCVGGRALILLENMLTGETKREEIGFSVGGRKSGAFTCTSDFAHCGRIRIKVEELIAGDFIGAYEKRRRSDLKTYNLALPLTYPIEVDMGQGNQTDINSDEYSMLKSGFDPSEVFAMREYRYGDKIKNIHWKLSEKVGELTVRELGLPINNSLLILMETSFPEGSGAPEPEVMDSIAETVISLSQSLCKEQIPHQIGWYDREAQHTRLHEIMEAGDISEGMAGLLAVQTAEDRQTVTMHFEEDRGKLEYSHVIIVGAFEDTRIHTGLCEGTVTNLVCRIDGQMGREAVNNDQIISFSPDSMEKDLFYVEV